MIMKTDKRAQITQKQHKKIFGKSILVEVENIHRDFVCFEVVFGHNTKADELSQEMSKKL